VAVSAVVGVNLLWLVPGVVGGSEDHVVGHLLAVGDLDPPELRLRLYAQPGLARAHPGLVERFETVTAGGPLGTKAGRVAVEHTWLALACRRDDLVHHPGGVVPLVRSVPGVVTVHDLQPLDLPAHFPALKRRWLAATLPRSVTAARLVVTPSRFTADRLVERLGVDPSRIWVVPHALVPADATPPPADQARRLAAAHGRYLLYPAIAYPHKRHVDLLEAFARLAPTYGDLNLVLTGGPAQETPTIERWCRASGLGHRVHRLGRVPRSELDLLLRCAAAVVVPSEYEGFGIPALEAMARGTPTVVADAGSLPEVVGDAAVVVPPRRPDALADALAGLLDDPGRAARLAAAGRLRAARFDRRSAAEALVGVYRQALDPAGGRLR
jgi:alpha-1,3-rhamnosyl/mannosyltransferase